MYFINNYLLKRNNVENYTGLVTDNLFENMKKKNYIIDYENKNVSVCDEKKDCITKSYQKHFNSMEAIQLAKDKSQTSELLEKNNIPVPKYLIVKVNENEKMIYQRMNKRKISFPIVLKPINGTFGIDVVTNIDTMYELKNTLEDFKKKEYDSVMLEEQISGDCYRIFVFNNQVIDIIKREKPYIIGNGQNTLEQLINRRNLEQEKIGMFSTKNISHKYLEKQGYRINEIPKANEKIYITDIINMHNGARISRISIDSIPIKNIDLFLKVNNVMDINCTGLDYLSDDITVEYDINNSKILEVNGTPDTEIHNKIEFDGETFFEKIANNIF
jgi:glutathione synthase/RimK-type ligase-like ATP-grasp enzyme